MHRQRVNICGTLIDPYTLDEAIEEIIRYASSTASPAYVVTPNAQHILLLQQDSAFREAYRNALLVVPDGVPLLWAATFLRTPLRGRVNGTDLFEKLCAVAAQQGLRVFLLGGNPGSADGAAQTLRLRHPQLQVAGYCPPRGFEKDPIELGQITAKIKSAMPHLLFVGLGSPKGEQWIYSYHREVGVPISVGVGASLDLVAGVFKRAPKHMQERGLEWLYRLLIEPRRLWRRYLLGNPRFLWQVLKQRIGLS